MIKKSKKDLVSELLKKDLEGLTIIEIAHKLDISRNTVSVALAELRGAGFIKVRVVGMAKLHYWRKKK